MIALLLSSLLFVFGIICTISTIPQSKRKFLQLWPQYTNTNTNTNTCNHHKSAVTATEKSIPPEHHASESCRVSLRGVFATFDKNDDGFITKDELKQSLKNMGIAAVEKDVADMVNRVDSNGDGLIDFDEFCELYDSISGDEVANHEEKGDDGDLKEAFDVFDGNKDGLITVEELGMVLSSLGFIEGKKLEDCKEMIEKVDMDGDGMVNFDEFKVMMRNGGALITVT